MDTADSELAIERELISQLKAGQLTPQQARLGASVLAFPGRLRVFAAASEVSRAAASNRLPRLDKE